MYGEDGWCHACGVPQRPQTGSMVLQRKGLTLAGAWVPNWRFDTICVTREVADRVATRFEVELRDVRWPGESLGDAVQIVVPSTARAWFDESELRARAIEAHGRAGATCKVCGVWRWMPLGFAMLPTLTDTSVLDSLDIAASPEWFGDGWRAYHRVLVRRELAELLREASPRDFSIMEIDAPGTATHEPPRLPVAVEPVQAGAVSEIFVAALVPGVTIQGEPSAAARRRAVKARELLEASGGLVSADALAEAARRFMDGGEVAQALSLWRQAAARGSTDAEDALREYAAVEGE